MKPFEKEKASKVDEIVDVKAARIWERKSIQRWLNCRDEIADVKAVGMLAFEKENTSKVDEIANVKATRLGSVDAKKIVDNVVPNL